MIVPVQQLVTVTGDYAIKVAARHNYYLFNLLGFIKCKPYPTPVGLVVVEKGKGVAIEGSAESPAGIVEVATGCANGFPKYALIPLVIKLNLGEVSKAVLPANVPDIPASGWFAIDENGIIR